MRLATRLNELQAADDRAAAAPQQALSSQVVQLIGVFEPVLRAIVLRRQPVKAGAGRDSSPGHVETPDTPATSAQEAARR